MMNRCTMRVACNGKGVVAQTMDTRWRENKKKEFRAYLSVSQRMSRRSNARAVLEQRRSGGRNDRMRWWWEGREQFLGILYLVTGTPFGSVASLEVRESRTAWARADFEDFRRALEDSGGLWRPEKRRKSDLHARPDRAAWLTAKTPGV